MSIHLLTPLTFWPPVKVGLMLYIKLALYQSSGLWDICHYNCTQMSSEHQSQMKMS